MQAKNAQKSKKKQKKSFKTPYRDSHSNVLTKKSNLLITLQKKT